MRASRWSRSQARLVLGLAVVTGALTALPSTGFGQADVSPSAPPSPAAASPAPSPSVAPAMLSSDPRTFAWYDLLSTGAGEELHVGRFDDRTWVALTSDDPIVASGPGNGRVIAATARERGSDLWLIDTATGEVETLRRDNRRIESVALEPSGGMWWWVTTDADGASTLWRRSGPGRRAMLVAGPRPTRLSIVTAGSGRVAWWGVDGRGRRFATIVDTDGNTVPVKPIVGDVVGLLGDELITYGTAGSALGYPLVAFDPATGTTREVVAGGASFATIGMDATGAPVLIAQALDETGAWRYEVIDAEGRVTLLDGAVPTGVSLAGAARDQGSTTPGFLPLTANGGFADVDMATDWLLLPFDGSPATGPALPVASTAP